MNGTPGLTRLFGQREGALPTLMYRTQPAAAVLAVAVAMAKAKENIVSMKKLDKYGQV